MRPTSIETPIAAALDRLTAMRAIVNRRASCCHPRDLESDYCWRGVAAGHGAFRDVTHTLRSNLV
jgi:hypothetical protein